MGGGMSMYSGLLTGSLPPAFQSALRPGFYWWYLRSSFYVKYVVIRARKMRMLQRS
ncbi:hypothetical protein ARMGADRAFT_723803 [Armillaria gallica]|uniref:Uncharacterized protein n=1 Tax=Armillaria gallica TaxID=47427 RepID=A0A2H3E6N7_ARMGA|nr:hypothetical protein ARMGADRAFT_723803 [Armillaria gallica]